MIYGEGGLYGSEGVGGKGRGVDSCRTIMGCCSGMRRSSIGERVWGQCNGHYHYGSLTVDQGSASPRGLLTPLLLEDQPARQPAATVEITALVQE